jgi:hypothetical protein
LTTGSISGTIHKIEPVQPLPPPEPPLSPAFRWGGCGRVEKANPYQQYARWELPFVAWAEENGYAIDFATNLDLELRPGIVKPYKLLLSLGHDEYWSTPMRDTEPPPTPGLRREGSRGERKR